MKHRKTRPTTWVFGFLLVAGLLYGTILIALNKDGVVTLPWGKYSFGSSIALVFLGVAVSATGLILNFRAAKRQGELRPRSPKRR